jgi:hypothetical protein
MFSKEQISKINQLYTKKIQEVVKNPETNYLGKITAIGNALEKVEKHISPKSQIHCVPKAKEVVETWQGCVFLHRLWQCQLIEDEAGW